MGKFQFTRLDLSNPEQQELIDRAIAVARDDETGPLSLQVVLARLGLDDLVPYARRMDEARELDKRNHVPVEMAGFESNVISDVPRNDSVKLTLVMIGMMRTKQ